MNTNLLILLMGVILIVSCDNSRIYEHNQSLGKSWSWDEIRQFEIEIRDTASAYNLFLNVRHDLDYRYANCWLTIRTIRPSGQVSSDRVEIKMAEKDGRWTGQCTGEFCFKRELIGERKKFPERGLYVFEIQQDMREEFLAHLHDVGIRIEKVVDPVVSDR